MHKHLLITCMLAAIACPAIAQSPDTTSREILNRKSDTTETLKADTDFVNFKRHKVHKEKVYHPDTAHSPHRAVIYSLIIPGWGQVYNHRIWKVPVIYGILGSLGVAYIYNARNYRLFLALSKFRYEEKPPKKGERYYDDYNRSIKASPQQIYDAKDALRRDRDLCIMGTVLFWGINAIDAYIDAKFMHSYTLDDNFSIRVTPGVINQPVYARNAPGGYIPAIKVILNL